MRSSPGETVRGRERDGERERQEREQSEGERERWRQRERWREKTVRGRERARSLVRNTSPQKSIHINIISKTYIVNQECTRLTMVVMASHLEISS